MKTTFKFTDYLIISTYLLILILLYSLFKLQIIDNDYYKTIADRNYVRKNRIIATRGEIIDRNFRPIVSNIASVNLYLTPVSIKDKKALSSYLEREFDFNVEEFDKLLYEYRFRSYMKILIAENLTQEQHAEIAEDIDRYPGLLIESAQSRAYHYPNHFSGYIGGINSQEFKQLKDEGYSIDSRIGRAGIEKYYEVFLRGKDGWELTQVDARGRNLDLFRDVKDISAEKGLDIVLTIDNELQSYITSIMPDYSAGAVVVMDQHTGGILAYVSYPEFDQNIFMHRISPEIWNKLMNDENKPMMDRIIHSGYPPGSIFKPVVASLALEKSIINKDTKMRFCDGGMDVGNRYFKCWEEWGHGRLNVTEALKVSCDVFFYDVSLMLDLDEFQDYTKRNYLSVSTGIDLLNERNGFFPNTAWYKKNYGKYAGIIGPKVNLSIGQGEVLLSPIQMCAYYNALANDGIWRKPHLFMKTVGNKIIKYENTQTDIERQLPVSKENLAVIHEGLWKVMNESKGTANHIRYPGSRLYGKTGSAENHQGKQTHAWFAGYDLTDDPGITVVVFLENAGHGGSAAAPIAGKIFKYYHDYRKELSDAQL
jgi:penicillin-binding protein 2